MEQEIINRAKWLYAYNGGYLTKEQCVKQIIKQNGNRCLKGIFELYNGITLNDYIEYIARQI